MADFYEYGFERLRVYEMIRLLRIDLKQLNLSLLIHEKCELSSQISRAASRYGFKHS